MVGWLVESRGRCGGNCEQDTSKTGVWCTKDLHSHRVRPILHYAFGLRFGKVCEQKCQKKSNWLAFLPNV